MDCLSLGVKMVGSVAFGVIWDEHDTQVSMKQGVTGVSF